MSRIGLGVGKSHSVEDQSINNYQIRVTNAGVGPAIIKDVRLLYKDEQITTWWNLFDAFEMNDSIPTYVTNSRISKNIIRQGENLRILSLKENLQLAQVFYENSDQIRIDIIYESIYGDQWKYTTSLTGKGESTEEVIPTIEEFDKEKSFKN
ncbi:hypothetical protein [Ekhidna sp.]